MYYVAVNWVAAGLVAHAADWPWSSAGAHLAGRGEYRVRVAPLLERAQAIGRPLGTPEWIAGLSTAWPISRAA